MNLSCLTIQVSHEGIRFDYPWNEKFGSYMTLLKDTIYIYI